MLRLDTRFIGEESTGKELPELTDDPTWIIDPIDGTTNFIHGFPHTCVVIGLSIKKEMVIGIVYNPVLEQLFTARRGRGAFLNNKPIKVSNVQGKLKLLFRKSQYSQLIYCYKRFVVLRIKINHCFLLFLFCF